MNKFQLFNLCKIILLFVLLTFSSCTFSDIKVDYKERSVEEIYNSALNLMNDENYIDAANEFEEVERQHPYSVWAVQAQIMTAAHTNMVSTKAAHSLTRKLVLGTLMFMVTELLMV